MLFGSDLSTCWRRFLRSGKEKRPPPIFFQKLGGGLFSRDEPVMEPNGEVDGTVVISNGLICSADTDIFYKNFVVYLV